MALSGSRLQGQLYTDIKAQLAALFPVDGALLPAEQTSFNDAQDRFAHAMANAIGPDVISEIVGHSIVPAGTFANGAGAVTGTSTVT